MKHDEKKIEELIRNAPVIVDTDNNYSFHENDVRFLAKQYSEHVIQKLLQKIIDIEESPSPFNADPERPLKHMYQNQGYTTAIIDIIKAINQE